MKLNCKPGDLAIVINGENSGLLVDVICIHPVWEGSMWLVKPHGNGTSLMGTFNAGEEVGCMDEKLRPIRDQPGEDETLTWAPVPHKETV